MNFHLNPAVGAATAALAMIGQSSGFVVSTPSQWRSNMNPLNPMKSTQGRVSLPSGLDLRLALQDGVTPGPDLASIEPSESPQKAVNGAKPKGKDEIKDAETTESIIRKPYGHTPSGLKARQAVKNGLYGALGFSTAVGVAKGVEPPLVQFQVKADPPSLFYNFPIDEAQIQGLKDYIGLPDDWTLLPVTSVEGEAPEHMMSLNVYEVGGITEGLRAEWSVYVDRGDGEPSYFVFKTHVEKFSMDPENIVTRPAKSFTHGIEDGAICTNILGHDGEAFSIRVPLDDTQEPRELKSDRQWLAANDYIFWPGGICDKVFFSSDVYNAPLIDHSSDDVELTHRALHTQFLKKGPPTVLALSKPATFIVSPWDNVDKGSEK